MVSADREEVKAAAITGLRTALISGAGAPGAVRASWYRNPEFSSVLFTEALKRFFGESPDIRAITGFVSRIRPGEVGFPRREAEAVVRASLGETMFFDCVHPGQFSYMEIGIAVLDRLFLEWRPSGAEIDSMFGRVREVQAAVDERSPELAPAVDDWFAAGMHESPFAFPLDAGQVQRPDER